MSDTENTKLFALRGATTVKANEADQIIAATEELLVAGSAEQKDEWVPRLVAGEAIGTLAWADPATDTSFVLLTSLPKNVSGALLLYPVSDQVSAA